MPAATADALCQDGIGGATGGGDTVTVIDGHRAAVATVTAAAADGDIGTQVQLVGGILSRGGGGAGAAIAATAADALCHDAVRVIPQRIDQTHTARGDIAGLATVASAAAEAEADRNRATIAGTGTSGSKAGAEAAAAATATDALGEQAGGVAPCGGKVSGHISADIVRLAACATAATNGHGDLAAALFGATGGGADIEAAIATAAAYGLRGYRAGIIAAGGDIVDHREVYGRSITTTIRAAAEANADRRATGLCDAAGEADIEAAVAATTAEALREDTERHLALGRDIISGRCGYRTGITAARTRSTEPYRHRSAAGAGTAASHIDIETAIAATATDALRDETGGAVLAGGDGPGRAGADIAGVAAHIAAATQADRHRTAALAGTAGGGTDVESTVAATATDGLGGHPGGVATRGADPVVDGQIDAGRIATTGPAAADADVDRATAGTRAAGGDIDVEAAVATTAAEALCQHR